MGRRIRARSKRRTNLRSNLHKVRRNTMKRRNTIRKVSKRKVYKNKTIKRRNTKRKNRGGAAAAYNKSLKNPGVQKALRKAMQADKKKKERERLERENKEKAKENMLGIIRSQLKKDMPDSGWDVRFTERDEKVEYFRDSGGTEEVSENWPEDDDHLSSSSTDTPREDDGRLSSSSTDTPREDDDTPTQTRSRQRVVTVGDDGKTPREERLIPMRSKPRKR